MRPNSHKLKIISGHKMICALLAVLFSTACTISAISPDVVDISTPPKWSTSDDAEDIQESWQEVFNDSQLDGFISEAIRNNHLLAEQQARVAEAEKSIVISAAAKYPELNLGFDASRRQTIVSETAKTLSTNFELGLDLNWEIDLWGKLNDAEQQSLLLLYSEQARLSDNAQALAADVGRVWYEVMANQELLLLFQKRHDNLKDNLEIINQSYEQGINNALDVYLTRDTVEQESARVTSQAQTLMESIIRLQLLLTRYPDGKLDINGSLPFIDSPVQAGLPSALIKRRPDIQQAWFELLSTDKALAIAHKNRFPSLSLVAASSDISDELGSLLDGSSLAWSLLGSLTQPLFNAGRLKATEEQARARVMQAEKRYLEQLQQAFSEVEIAISRQFSLEKQYQSILASNENAAAAYALSFEQYLRGLVTYTTVLESQRRAFDAETSVIELRNQLLQNRINLFEALGGDFSAEASELFRIGTTE